MVGKVPEILAPLMQPHVQKVDDALEPGLVSLTWMSLNLDSFIDGVNYELKELEALINCAVDILESRIYALFQEMLDVSLCELPTGESVAVEYFVKQTEVKMLSL